MIWHLEYLDERLYNETMPNEAEMEKIKTNFDIESKCPPSNFYWTQWQSYNNPSETGYDGNDYETLDLHRSKFKKYFKQLIKQNE